MCIAKINLRFDLGAVTVEISEARAHLARSSDPQSFSLRGAAPSTPLPVRRPVCHPDEVSGAWEATSRLPTPPRLALPWCAFRGSKPTRYVYPFRPALFSARMPPSQNQFDRLNADRTYDWHMSR